MKNITVIDVLGFVLCAVNCLGLVLGFFALLFGIALMSPVLTFWGIGLVVSALCADWIADRI